MEIPIIQNPRVAFYVVVAGLFIYLMLPCPACYIAAIPVLYGMYSQYRVWRG